MRRITQRGRNRSTRMQGRRDDNIRRRDASTQREERLRFRASLVRPGLRTARPACDRTRRRQARSYSTRRALCGLTTISKASFRLPLLSTGAPAQPADLLDADGSPEEVVIAYHERTKHYFHRYAASLGCMDWATQPR